MTVNLSLSGIVDVSSGSQKFTVERIVDLPVSSDISNVLELCSQGLWIDYDSGLDGQDRIIKMYRIDFP